MSTYAPPADPWVALGGPGKVVKILSTLLKADGGTATVSASAARRMDPFIDRDDVPVLAHAAIAHAQFETIHPFLDGNGRVGRLLITLLLCAENVLQQPLLYLSLFFKQHRDAYYDHLQRVRTEGAWEEWLEFFLEGVIAVAGSATETACARGPSARSW